MNRSNAGNEVEWLAPEPVEPVVVKKVFLHVTRSCNQACAYCYFAAEAPRPGEEMSTADYARLWPELVALRPGKVVFTGGEPLLRPDLFELLQGMKHADPDHTIRRCVNTNGRGMTPQTARQLVGVADEVRVSIDAMQERNDALRGPGSFQAAMRAFEALRDEGFEPKALITVTTEGLPDLEAVIGLLLSKGVTQITLNRLRTIGRGADKRGWQAAPEAVYDSVLRAWARHLPDHLPPSFARSEMPSHHCGVGHFVNILPDGGIFPCHVLTSPEFGCGNVRQLSLLELCDSRGLLGMLARLDFRRLAQMHPRLRPLAKSGACLGCVYRDTQLLPAWREAFATRAHAVNGAPSS